MKSTRFSEEQIVTILKEHELGAKVTRQVDDVLAQIDHSAIPGTRPRTAIATLISGKATRSRYGLRSDPVIFGTPGYSQCAGGFPLAINALFYDLSARKTGCDAVTRPSPV
jgi:hypothetical protein